MIPYEIEKLSPGRLKLTTPILKHLHHPEESVKAYFSRFKGVKRVRYYKKTGRITIEYDPMVFDLIEFLNTLRETTRELFLEDLAKEEPPKRSANGGAGRWLTLTSLGFLPYLMRGLIPNYFLSGIALISAKPLFERLFNSLRERKLDVHFLDSSAVLLSALTGNPLSAQSMLFLLALGDYLSEKIEKKAYSQIEKLFSYRENTAWLVIEEGQSQEVKAIDLKKGDLIVSYAGEKIPADGIVEKGEALVNQASLTGESNPVHKKEGDKVFAGTFIEDGKLYIRVESAGEDTVIAKIAKMVEENLKEPLDIQKMAEDFANRFVLPTLALGLTSYMVSRQISRLTSTIIIDYHTGVHLNTPLTILSTIAYLSKYGILVKSGGKLEALAKADTFVFDKTGTLTLGLPVIEDILGLDVSEEKVLLYAASLEQRITHPVAKAILKMADERKLELLPREDSNYYIGMGIEGRLNGVKYMLGSTRFLLEKNIKISSEVRALVDKFHQEAKSVLYLIRGKKIIGLLTFRDPLRAETKEVVSELLRRGKRVILCTGDNEGIAKYVALTLGIIEYYGRTFPAEKAELVKRLKEEGRVVVFVGDGVNDSPALSNAHVGVSLRTGTDIAIEVADVVIGEDLRHLLLAIDIANSTLRKIERIYKINAIANTIGLIGSAVGFINSTFSTLINNGTTLLLGLYAIKNHN